MEVVEVVEVMNLRYIYRHPVEVVEAWWKFGVRGGSSGSLVEVVEVWWK